jgi:hypothetical protein
VTTWKVGRVYDYYGQALRCVDRYFEELLEVVALQNADEPWDGLPPSYRLTLFNICGIIPGKPAFFRTAEIGKCMRPQVTDWLGGTMRAELCRHDWHKEPVLANAGPNSGHLCCRSCGARLDGPDPIVESRKSERQGLDCD